MYEKYETDDFNEVFNVLLTLRKRKLKTKNELVEQIKLWMKFLNKIIIRNPEKKIWNSKW